jgi:hypothetical protein
LEVKNIDIETLKANSNKKSEVITNLDEKLLTVYTLEFKIKDAFNSFKNEIKVNIIII